MGSIRFSYDDKNVDKQALKFMTFSMDEKQFVSLSVAEYMIVSLSLVLVIAKFFPAVHDQVIVSRVTRPEHQSLYWGTAVVSNFFVYGLLFTVARAWSISLQSFYVVNNIEPFSFWVAVLSLTCFHEVFVHIILFVGACIASRNKATGVDFPNGLAKYFIKVSFCWSCFCFCGCCKDKILRVLILFSFMCFVYHSIMDAISVAFQFIEGSFATLISLALLYVSFLVFLVLLVSFSFFSLFRDRNGSEMSRRQFFDCVGGVLIFTTVFVSVVLMLVLYMIIVFSLNLKGVTGIVTGLIPSLALSAASWFIRTLERRLGHKTANGVSGCGERGRALNGGERMELEDAADSHRLLQP